MSASLATALPHPSAATPPAPGARLDQLAPRPWPARGTDSEPGCIFDANGEMVAAVDPWGDRDDAEAAEIAEAICVAVNGAVLRG